MSLQVLGQKKVTPTTLIARREQSHLLAPCHPECDWLRTAA